MPVPKARAIEASDRSRKILEGILRRRTVPLWLVTRVRIIVRALEGCTNTAIAEELRVDRNGVRLWRDRWQSTTEGREALESEQVADQELEAFIIGIYFDNVTFGV